MKWLTNSPIEPEDADAARYRIGKIVGPPKKTAWRSVEQLSAMGMIGIYEPEHSAPEPVKEHESVA